MSEFIEPVHYAAREVAQRRWRPASVIAHAEQEPDAAVRLLVPQGSGQLATGIIEFGDWVGMFGGGMTAATQWRTSERSTAGELFPAWPSTTRVARNPSMRKDFLDSAPEIAQPKTREAQHRHPDGQRRVQRLVTIQAALGLTMQDLAAMLNLSRPQLYRWLDSSQHVRLQEAKRQRLDTVERIAGAWQARSAAPLRAVAHEPLANGHTVFGLLTAAAIDEAAVYAMFDELTAKLQAQPKTLSQRLADAGFKRRPSIRSLPSDE